MKIQIWGARGSIPTPISARELREKMITVLEGAKGIDLDDPMAVRAYVDNLHALVAGTAGGDTACVEIQANGQTIILDAGSGIRALGQALMAGPCGRGEGVIHLFFSHTHWDHIQGLPFFIPAYVPGNRIIIYGIHPVQVALAEQTKPATFPIALDDLSASLEFVPLKERERLTLGDIHITNMRLYHPGDAYAYRFEHQGIAFVYATDVECKDVGNESLQPYVNFFSGADALIFDSQFTLRESTLAKADWGHSSALIGAEIARRAKVKRLILFHHDPTTTDAELLKILEETRTYQAKYEAEPSTEVLVGSTGLILDLMLPEAFTISSLSTPETAIVRITEDFDQQTAREVLTQLDGGGGPLPRLIVDLSQVQQLYIAGLRSLIDLRTFWKGHPMALAAVSKQAQEIIELTNCLDLFAIYPSVKEAQDALEAQATFRLPGHLINDRYRIEAKLRESDIGTVFKATDTRLDRQVALMILTPTLSQSTARRLLEQAQKTAHLQSPYIITLFDADEDRSLVYLVLEYTETSTLRDLMRGGHTPPLIEIAAGIASALEYAHSKHVFHGNLRPGNVLVGEEIKLTDFGLRMIEEGQHLVDNPVLGGTSHYLAPEQIAGKTIDARTDLYALGVILYQLATAQTPYLDAEQQTLEQRFEQAPISPRQLNAKLSRSFDHLILKLLAKDPAQRYSSAAQVLQVLASLDKGSAPSPEEASPAPATIASAQEVTTPELIPQYRGQLIGREQEVEQILQLWSLAEQGRGQTLFIGGEAGIGKTRLAEEAEAHIKEGQILLGRCSEFDGTPPYQPFVEMARHYLAQTSPDTVRQLMADSTAVTSFVAVLAPLITDLYDIVPDLPPLPALSPEQAETRMKSSLLQFIERATADRPWMLVLDDLHWSDPSSMQLLHYLARHVDNLPLLIVGTYRDVELETEHPLRELMGALSRLPTCHQLALTRLNHAQVGQLLSGLWGQDVPAEWVSAIFDRSGGNPFYVKEIAKTAVDDGLITFADDRWHFARVVDLKLPPKIRDIVLRRVTRVAGKTQEILRQAAVLGQQFAFADLLAVSELSEDHLLACLDEAMAHNLLREVDSGLALAFSNVEIQQVIYEDLSNLRRRRLHRQTGLTLEQYYQAEPGPVAGRLAYHFLQADDRPQAFIYSLRAGQHAQSLYAYQTALRWYTQAAGLLPEQVIYLPDHIALYRGLGDMYLTQTRFAQAINAYQSMALAAQAIQDTTAQVQALYALSSTQNSQGEYQAALETAKEAEQAARAAKTQPLLARALYEQGWALLSLGKTEAALAVAEQVLTFSSTLDATYEIGQSYNLLAAVHGAMGNYQQASEYQQQALALYRQLGDRNRVGVMLNNLGESYYRQEDYQSAAALYGEALGIAREIGDRAGEIVYQTNLGGAHLRTGEYAAAEANLLQVIQMPETIRSASLADTYRYLAEARLGLRKIAQALAEAQLALALARETEAPENIGLAWRTLGRVMAQQPDPITVDDRVYTSVDCFNESLRTFAAIHRPGERARTLQAWAAYEETRGNSRKARQLQKEAQEILNQLSRKT